ncbi:MAG: acyl-homoserine-lactone synthase [Pseudomonadota bacterium]|jgi:N-acyl-L-homoserine lactone synthetase|nr:GNAT family N-acetyltransferase [Alphaproteobacteria bacterium]
MVYLITPNDYATHREDLDAMYRLRHKVFFEKLNWQVKSQDGMEKDEYDENYTYYLIYKDKNNVVRGCHRYIPMNNPCMFDGPFEFAFPDLKKYKNAKYWEASRLAVDFNFDAEYTKDDAKNVCVRIFAASVLLGLDADVKGFITLSYPSVIKIVSRYFKTSRLERSSVNGEEIHVTKYIPTTEAYDNLTKGLNLVNALPWQS